MILKLLDHLNDLLRLFDKLGNIFWEIFIYLGYFMLKSLINLILKSLCTTQKANDCGICSKQNNKLNLSYNFLLKPINYLLFYNLLLKITYIILIFTNFVILTIIPLITNTFNR